MSDDRRRAACERKAFFRDHATAACIGRLHGLAPYVCPVCRLYHLTSRRRR